MRPKKYICSTRRKVSKVTTSLSHECRLAIQWSAIGDIDRNDAFFDGCATQEICFCLNLMERFLNQRHPVVSCEVKAAAPSPASDKGNNTHELVGAVGEILGFEDPSKMDPTASLIDLGMDSVMGVEVLHAVQRICGLTLFMQNVRLLSLNDLLDMSGNSGKGKIA
ncbi:fatty acid synthase-like [Amblyomma americanum]